MNEKSDVVSASSGSDHKKLEAKVPIQSATDVLQHAEAARGVFVAESSLGLYLPEPMLARAIACMQKCT